MRIRDRIKELRRVKASELRPNPRNWRTHPKHQQDALKGVLSEIGYADALLARELPDGSLELVDGHLRAETTPSQMVPVLVLDVDEAEAAKLLATLDPLAALAGRDDAMLAELLEDVETQNEALRAMIETLGNDEPPRKLSESPEDTASEKPAVNVPELYQVVVQCRDEAEQKAVFERLTGEGFACTLLMM